MRSTHAVERRDGGGLARPAVEVLPAVTITIREHRVGPLAGWRVHQAGGKYDNRALKERGQLLGGTREKAEADGRRVAMESGFSYLAPMDRRLL